MKISITMAVIISLLLLLVQCNTPEEQNKKDLDENMLDMMAYHDNLGEYLRKGDAEYSQWLLEGLDSSLHVIAAKFEKHRKLDDPFEKYYNKLLAGPINDIRNGLRQNNFPAAISAYHHLTKNCNRCHIDHEVYKEVIDWSNAEIH